MMQGDALLTSIGQIICIYGRSGLSRRFLGLYAIARFYIHCWDMLMSCWPAIRQSSGGGDELPICLSRLSAWASLLKSRSPAVLGVQCLFSNQHGSQCSQVIQPLGYFCVESGVLSIAP